MTRPLVTFPSPANVVVDFLAVALELVTVEVSAMLPKVWTPRQTPHIVVAVDGTPVADAPVSISPTIRIVAWSDSPTRSHDLVSLAAGHMEAHNGALFTARILTGPFPSNDPTHADARLCAITLRTRIRSVPV